MIEVHCKECGNTQHFAATPEAHAFRVTIEHAEGCAFFAAIEAGTAEAWMAQHGYPIEWRRLHPADA